MHGVKNIKYQTINFVQNIVFQVVIPCALLLCGYQQLEENGDGFYENYTTAYCNANSVMSIAKLLTQNC